MNCSPLWMAAALIPLACNATSTDSNSSDPITPEKNQKPNIIFIFSDDHALQAISAYNFRGRNLNQTPNIDRIAKDGAIFQNTFCANSICTPSRASVLSGKHSHLNGVTMWQSFDGSQTTFPKELQKAGYTTAIFGKWHLGSKPTGFDEWMVYPGQGDYYNPKYITPKGNTQIQGYSTDINTDISIDFLKRHQNNDKPFLLMCHFKAPHRNWLPAPEQLKTIGTQQPYQEPHNLFDQYQGKFSEMSKHKMGIDKHLTIYSDLKIPPKGKESLALKGMNPEQQALWKSAYEPIIEDFYQKNLKGEELVKWKYQRYLQDYLACIESVDHNVGRILDFLKESGLEQNTIVVYSSDQGFYLGEHGWYDKRWMYEESFRMPFLMKWPARIPAGTKVAPLTQNIDFGPTFLDAAGVKIPEDMQGKSMLPLISQKLPKIHDSLYFHYYDGPGEHGVAKHYGIRTPTHKLIHYYKTNEWELFDLEQDPEEMKNLASDPNSQDLLNSLKEQLKQLKIEVQNPITSIEEEKAYFENKKKKKK